jgi:YgiT-type zinc finger domain-containing protein
MLEYGIDNDRGLKLQKMKCLVCKHTGTQEGETTVTIEHGDMIMVVKKVPAQVCPNCGEAYADEEASGQLLEMAERMAQSGTFVNIRHYQAC